MKSKDDPSPQQIARMNRQRLAAEEGARAMADVAKQASDVRKNMARLRDLRLAKEADAAQEEIATGSAPKGKLKKRVK
jgi:hypothetical protein